MYQVINNLPIDYDFQSKTKEELKLNGLRKIKKADYKN